jgi:hypothetical protein
MMSRPNEAHMQRIEDLERFASHCKGLYTEDEEKPPIFTVIDNMEDVVDPSRRYQSAGTEARRALQGIHFQEGSERCYGLAMILLARFDTPSKVDDAKKFQLGKAEDYADEALRVMPTSAAAWNIKLGDQILLAEEKLSENQPKEYLKAIVQPTRDFIKVEMYDETLVGRYKYLNNTAFAESLALMRLIDSEQEKRVSCADFESIFGRSVESIAKETRELTDSLMQLPLDKAGYLETRSEVHAVLATMVSSRMLAQEKRRAICNALDLKYESADSALLSVSTNCFYLSLDNITPEELQNELETFETNRFFKLWPDVDRQIAKQTIQQRCPIATAAALSATAQQSK